MGFFSYSRVPVLYVQLLENSQPGRAARHCRDGLGPERARQMNVVQVSGAPKDIGIAQGEATGDVIAAALALYRRLLEDMGRDPEAVAAESGPFVDVARGVLPDGVAEMEGVAEGAGISLEEAALLNCLEEVWPEPAAVPEACTTMISGRYFMHAEQWYAAHSGIAVVVAAPDDGPGFVSPTCAGFLPAVGFNAAGFAQGIDSLVAPDDRLGVPRVFVSRAALGARGIDAAIAAAGTAERAGGYAHVFASGDRSVTVETSSSTASVLEDVPAHSNHYLSPSKPSGHPGSRGSRARLTRARELLAESPPKTLDDCARLLSDHSSAPQSICLHESGPDASGTVFGMACDLATGRMLVSDGPPCSGAWRPFEMAPTVADVV